MLRLLKYGLFLLILVLGIIAGLTSVVISDKESSIKNMKSIITKKIDQAFQYAKRSPFPKKEDLFKYLYK